MSVHWHDAKTDPPNKDGEYFVHMVREVDHKPVDEYLQMIYYLDDWFYNDWEMTEMVVEWAGLPTRRR